MKNLVESGLFRHDLDNLILPLLEIDTFESKIDNARAIVVAFFVFDQEPARDLERFIENGDIELLDAETSPAPTEDGYYVVFVELARDKNFPELLIKMTHAIDNATNIDQWQFKSINDSDIYDLTEENLAEHVNLDPKTVPPDETQEHDEIEDLEIEKSKTPDQDQEISETLKSGLMESYSVKDNIIALNSTGIIKQYRVIAFSDQEPSIPICGLNIGNPLINESSILYRLLGNAYTVDIVDNGLLVGSDQGYLVLEPLDR